MKRDRAKTRRRETRKRRPEHLRERKSIVRTASRPNKTLSTHGAPCGRMPCEKSQESAGGCESRPDPENVCRSVGYYAPALVEKREPFTRGWYDAVIVGVSLTVPPWDGRRGIVPRSPRSHARCYHARVGCSRNRCCPPPASGHEGASRSAAGHIIRCRRHVVELIATTH
jgi:hypothetical protein